MVNPIRRSPPPPCKSSAEKKAPKEVDQRVNKAVKQSRNAPRPPPLHSHKTSQLLNSEKAYFEAEKTAKMARSKAFDIRQAALRAQKAAVLAERAHLARQAAALRQMQEAAIAKQAAEEATRRAESLRREAKIRAYLERPAGKKQDKRIKKSLLSPDKKKKKKN